MHDYLKDAAEAADLSDAKLIALYDQIRNRDHPTGFEQAVLDEMERRHLMPPR
ncbi:hypothetical protein [Sphingobium sp.]|uniref:hypothetical protein n=1 Tax=Sphingobium sp. TaxID=1912891 RepID=UPI0035C6D3F5